LRLALSDGFTDAGRFSPSLRSETAALDASAQLPDWTADVSEETAAFRSPD